MIDYNSLLQQAIAETQGSGSYEHVAAHMVDMVFPVWTTAYKRATRRETEIEQIMLNGFSYYFDNYSAAVDRGDVEESSVEDRLVGVIGRSLPPSKRRESGRIKGWLGPNSVMPLEEPDKGHFIAHSIGGLVDGFEINLFVQRRDLNRGRSFEGRQYRSMERYCARVPGTLCFSRPLYFGSSSIPDLIEYGVLRQEGPNWWIERFANSLEASDIRSAGGPAEDE